MSCISAKALLEGWMLVVICTLHQELGAGGDHIVVSKFMD